MSASPVRLVKRYLCVKKLTVNDGFTNKSVKLPRAEARIFMGELRNRQVIPLVLLDEEGSCWELFCTCTGAQYALSRIGAFCEAHGVRPGYYLIFYADYDHVVRLAVREQLPEDVQAAIAAARAAAVAVRANPGRASVQQPQPQEQQQQQSQDAGAVSNNSAAPSSFPAGQPAAQPVLDDPLALDEMPAAATSSGIVSGHKASLLSTASVPAQKLADREPSRPMPLQDRSNLAAAPADGATKSAGKSKATPGRPNPSAAVLTPGAAVHSVRPDKENDAAVLARPAEKVHSPTSSSPSVSTGVLQAQATTLHGRTPPHPPPASRPAPQTPPPPPSAPPLPSPPPYSWTLQRLQSSQPSLPPATRLRMRFEARLRSQAGKLHPLSVRTGPESPPPSSPRFPSDDDNCCATWPASLSSCYSMQRSSPMPQNSVFAFPCAGMVTGYGHPIYGSQHGGLSAGMHLQHGSFGPYPAAYGGGGCAAPNGAEPQHCQQRQLQQGMGQCAPVHQQPMLREDCNQQLQCDELLDWEGVRGPARGTDVALARPGGFVVPGQPHPQHQPCPVYQVPQPQQLLQSSSHPAVPAAKPKVNMGLVRKLLLLQGGQAGAQRCPETAASGAVSGRDGQQQQQDGRALLEVFANPQSALQPTQPNSVMGPTWDGLLLSLAATNSSLRQLLGMSATAGVIGLSTPPTGEGTSSNPNKDFGTSKAPAMGPAVPASTSQPLTNDDSLRSRAQVGGPRALPGTQGPGPDATAEGTGMDCAPAAGEAVQRRRQQQPQQEEEAEAGSGGARSKSSLSIARDGPGLPADVPSCKRLRPESSLLARKALTSHDLLMDRVALSFMPGAYALLGGLLLQGGQADGEVGYTVGTGREAQAEVPAAVKRMEQLPEQEAVDIVVESGAHYEGLLVVRESTAGARAGADMLGCDWELQGLRSYLIRRQAGVGDVLTLRIDGRDQQPSDRLRLVAQLQRAA